VLSVHLTDQLSNFRIIPDYLKVVDFIEELEAYSFFSKADSS